MSASLRAPLLGKNLVRLIYLDEAGISRGEPAIAVAGVLVHGDQQATELHRLVDAVVEKFIPEPDRQGFVFHATDIYHGSGYFDRALWSVETRNAILLDLAGVIEALSLPVVVSGYRKDTFGAGVISDADFRTPELKKNLIQATAMMDCAIWSDRWLAQFAPSENAMLIAEDADRIKLLAKTILRTLRSSALLAQNGLAEAAKIYDLPLKRIIDTVHFAAKADAVALQLADLCAFIMGRALKDKPVPLDVFRILDKHSRWLVSRMAMFSDQAMPAALPGQS